jgi:tetratricopeptide (TPR) repeat protein
MRALFRLACVAALLVGDPGVVHADEAASADLDAARDLFFEGQSLANEGRWSEACERFEKSLAIKRSAITLYSLGVAQLESDRFVEAMESLQAFLADPATDATLPFREPAEKAVAELEARVARLTIRIVPADAPDLVITLDDQPMPSAALGGPWLANPGRHRLTVTARGYQPNEQRFAVADGASREIQIDLVPTPEALPPPPRPAAPPAAFPAAPIVFIAVGGATLLVATGLGVAALEEASAAPSQDGAEAESARTKGLAADVLFGIGGVVTAVGLVFLAVELTSDASPNGPARFGPEGLTVRF